MRLRRSSLAGPRRRARERAAPGPLRDALAEPLPDADTLTDRLPLLAVDIETTGLDAEQDRVLSIGWVPVDGRDIVLAGARYRIVRPEGDEPVGPSATVHRLKTKKMKREAGESASGRYRRFPTSPIRRLVL